MISLWARRPIVTVLLACAALSCVRQPTPEIDRPRLAVIIVVDQMRADFLDRFADQYNGGLARLIRDGHQFTNAHQDHARTETAAGHVTISTGRFPSSHAIIGNSFFDRTAGRSRYSVEDDASPIIGFEAEQGMSPANIDGSSLGDWLKAVSPESKVFSLAIKDRSAIGMAGKRPDGVYWYHYASGRWVTSTYYTETYPDWADAFNEADHAGSFFGRPWTLSRDESAYTASREDDFPSESDGTHTTFPHQMTDPGEGPDRRFYSWLPTSPYGAALTLRFAQDLVVQEGVGQDDTPDLLFVGISSADFVGHRYGPYSREAQDYYLQLDTFLGDFLSFLDERVGEHAYTIALSADHGALAMPEELTRRGQDAGRFDPRPFFEELRTLAAEAAESGAIPSVPRLQYIGGLVFHFEEAAPTPRELAAFRRQVADLARANAFVAEAFTYEELRDGTGAGITYDRHRRSFHPDRSADVVVSLRERYLLGAQPVGTSHGSPWDYDTHVPLVLAGPGISAGENGMRARTADLAPTIARLFQIPAPDDLDGRTLEVGPVATR